MVEGTTSVALSLTSRRWAALFRVWGTLVAASAVGCEPVPDTVRLEVYSWWGAEPEQVAFDRVIGLHAEAHPDVEVENLADPSAVDQRERVAGRVLAGAPPSTFQANIGADLLRWAVVDAQDPRVPTRNHLEDLTELFLETRLFEELPLALIDALTLPGHGPYAVPINLHRANVLYYNAARLELFRERNAGKSFLDLETLCPADRNAPRLDLEIAVGVDEGFTLVLLAFENVLPALAGPEFYSSVFEGRASGDVAGVLRRTVECVHYLSRHFVSVPADFGWVAAVEQVRTGAAAFTVMGDWASGLLSDELSSGAVVARPFPQTDDVFVFTADTFPLPAGVEHREQVLGFLETIASPGAQRVFSSVKGSLPARNDVPMGPLEAASALRRDEFFAAVQVLATSGYFPPYYPQRVLERKLQALVDEKGGAEEIDAVVAELVDAQPLFASFQARLHEGASPRTTP
jgi:glucose/mannose transport system substrate-binding protein